MAKFYNLSSSIRYASSICCSTLGTVAAAEEICFEFAARNRAAFWISLRRLAVMIFFDFSFLRETAKSSRFRRGSSIDANVYKIGWRGDKVGQELLLTLHE